MVCSQLLFVVHYLLIVFCLFACMLTGAGTVCGGSGERVCQHRFLLSLLPGLYSRPSHQPLPRPFSALRSEHQVREKEEIMICVELLDT